MLPKSYDPQGTEDRIYTMWEEAGAFTADVNSKKEPFTISMPPPNATGQLHLGHAVMLALEDIFIRFQRQRGKEVLFVPGTDHASIATESVVIREIQKKEKIADPRKALGREELLRRIAAYVEKSRGTIRSQIRRMGASCDWSRERYTLEPALSRCVTEVFVRMCRDGLIYRGHRIVNWDPKMQTTVSDDEIEWVEERIPFYTLQYGPFRIGTARPETKFGDKYIVMHPEDERYRKYRHGETFTCEWINGPVTATVIKDKAVDPAFGTGAMTITPWHDAADFEIAERHGLPKQQIIGFDGILLATAGEFAGMEITEARPKIIEKLHAKGLLVKTEEDYVHRKAVNYRGGGTIEPQIKEQWFVDVGKQVVPWDRGELMSLKEILQEVIRSGRIKIIPQHFEKVYFHWIDNLKDWCISRQIFWGHRIPVWCREGDCSIDVHVGEHSPEERDWQQDPDTLDTWFSSALWTWSTLVDPKLAADPSLTLEEILEKSPDYQKFHPTAVIETGYDILFFWVARMILMTAYVTGDVPFKTVYLHGLVRTRDGRKMSKSDPSTVIDPLDMIEKYGADALRLSMIVGQTPGNDFRLYEEKIAGYRNFVNKLWNAARFVLLECEKQKIDPHAIGAGSWELGAGSGGLAGDFNRRIATLADRALLSALQNLIEDVTKGLESYRLSEAGERLYRFVWDFFCDWYLELSKDEASLSVLVHALRTLLVLLHPYIPFVTEELWSSVQPEGAGMLIKELWPAQDVSLLDQKAQGQMEVLIAVITAIRKLRIEQGIEQAKEIEVFVFAGKEHRDLLASQSVHIQRMGRVKELHVETKPRTMQNVASAFLAQGIEVHLSLEGLLDVAKERVRLEKEQSQLEKFLQGVRAKLKDKKFMKNAPEKVVAKEKEKEEDTQQKLTKIEERLKGLHGTS